MEHQEQTEKHVLIVEDDPSLNKVWIRLLPQLPSLHYHVTNSSADALTHLDKHAVDFLITDLAMPGINGIELIRKALQINPHVRIVLTSGLLGDLQDLKGMGQVIHILPKPYRNLEHVTEFLHQFLTHHKENEIARAESNDDHGVYVWEL